MIVARRKGKNDFHKDFRVRGDRVQEALLWLRRNNRYYSNIEIDYAVLNALPDDDPLPDLQVIEDDDLIQPADTDDDITDTAGVNADTEFLTMILTMVLTMVMMMVLTLHCKVPSFLT